MLFHVLCEFNGNVFDKLIDHEYAINFFDLFFKKMSNNLPIFLFFPAAFQHVRENLGELNSRVGADETDLVFLKGLLDSPAVTQLMKVSFQC